jgi:hypothetical protein
MTTLDVDAVDALALAHLPLVLRKLAPRHRAKSCLEIDRYTGRWCDARPGISGAGPVSMLAHLLTCSDDHAARLIEVLIEKSGA